MRSLLLALVIVLSLVPIVRAAEERAAPPEDSKAWYISVIGDNDAKYQSVLAMFDTGELKTLRDQVHFLPVTTDSPAYQDRYAKNQGSYPIKDLPCVRVQTEAGEVIYQAGGARLPGTAEKLYSEISSNIRAGRFVLLPWRRKHNVTPDDLKHEAVPAPVAPFPIVPPSNDGPPEVEALDLWLLAVLALCVGVALGIAESMRAKQAAPKK